jgi:hypothetical protein
VAITGRKILLSVTIARRSAWIVTEFGISGGGRG